MDAATIDPQYIYTGIIVVSLGVLLGIGSSAATIYYCVFKRTPSIGESLKTLEDKLRRDFVTRTEFDKHATDNKDDFVRHDGEIRAMRSYNAKTTREIFEELRKMNASFNKEFQDINKAIGRIEGALGNKK